MAVENGTNRNDDDTFLVDFNTHHRPIFYLASLGLNTKRDRQTDDRETDIAIEIGRLPKNKVVNAILWTKLCIKTVVLPMPTVAG